MHRPTVGRQPADISLADTCEKLGEEPGCIAFCYREFDRDSVFDVIKNNTVFVRKSFAMGHPFEKRYYLEGRKIR